MCLLLPRNNAPGPCTGGCVPVTAAGAQPGARGTADRAEGRTSPILGQGRACRQRSPGAPSTCSQIRSSFPSAAAGRRAQPSCKFPAVHRVCTMHRASCQEHCPRKQREAPAVQLQHSQAELRALGSMPAAPRGSAACRDPGLLAPSTWLARSQVRSLRAPAPSPTAQAVPPCPPGSGGACPTAPCSAPASILPSDPSYTSPGTTSRCPRSLRTGSQVWCHGAAAGARQAGAKLSLQAPRTQSSP